MYLRLLCLLIVITSCFGDAPFYDGIVFDDSPDNVSQESGESPVNSSLTSGDSSMDSSPEPQDKSPVGNYMIFHCENLDRSAGFPKLFARVRETIELVLLDLQHGIDSPHGYRAFFKSNKHLPIVQSVFQNITAGGNLRGRRPLINCLHPFGEAVTRPSAYSAICEPRKGHELVRARASQSGFLSLCPEFFRYPAFPNGTEDCPIIAGRRGFQKFAEEEDGSALTDTQFGILIRELVRSYNPLDKGPEEGGINGAKECFELNGEQSIQNAGNWVLYAASVKAGCTRFPPPNRLGP